MMKNICLNFMIDYAMFDGAVAMRLNIFFALFLPMGSGLTPLHFEFFSTYR